MIESLIGELYFDVELYDSIELGTRIRIGEHYNGSKCVIWKEGVFLVGQLEASISFQGSLVKLNNASTAPYVSYLNSELVGKQLQVAGSIIYTNENEGGYQIEFANGKKGWVIKKYTKLLE